MSWRDSANKVIRATLEEHKPATEKEARKVLREAYPFGERAMHPYKIWCDAVNKAMKLHYKMRFKPGDQLEITDGLFAAIQIEKGEKNPIEQDLLTQKFENKK